MKRGYLSDYFEGVAVKRLSAVEADVIRSNQPRRADRSGGRRQL
ncbi:hypothetical protein [Neisseria sp. 20925_1_37]